MKDPCVAVLLAAYNGEKYIGQQIESVLTQNYQNIRLIISDDFSSDGTAECIREYALNDERITLLQGEKRMGSAQANFMFLLKNAEADYYMFCDQDDFWFPEKVEAELKKMLELEKPGLPVLVHSDLSVANADLTLRAKSFFQYQGLAKEQSLAAELIQNNVTGCTVMLNPALRTLALKNSDTAGMVMHDWFLAILASATGVIGFVDRPLMLYRQHENNQVGAKNTGSVRYLVQKAADRKGVRKSLRQTFAQSAQIAALYQKELGAAYSMLREYGENARCGKWKKIQTCRRYGIWKNTLPRRIGQLLFL